MPQPYLGGHEVAQARYIAAQHEATVVRREREIAPLDLAALTPTAEAMARDPAEMADVIQIDDVRRAVAGLPDRIRRVMEMRYGLNCGVTWRLDEVAQALGLTRERIRLIERDGLSRLRAAML